MKALKNILFNQVTRNAVIYTFCLLFVYRLGSFVVTPGINADALLDAQSYTTGDITTLFNFFGGGSILTMSVFALGVTPYITASIIIQLLESDLIPSMNQWKYQGVDGQNKRSNYTKYLSIIIAFLQAIGISFGLSTATGVNFVGSNNYNEVLSYIVVALIMTAGTAILMWIGDRITEKGIGNGMSVLIMAGILAQMPTQMNAIYQVFVGKVGKELALLSLSWTLIAIITLIVIIMVIYYNLAYVKIPINYVRSGKSVMRKNSYLPIKLNPAGVIPVIFAQPLMIVMAFCVNWVFNNVTYFSSNGIGTLENIARSIFDANGQYWFIYVIVYASIIISFSIFYSYVQMNPENMTENLERQGAYIIGVRPGEETLDYFSKVILRTTLWGGLILALLAVLPTIIQQVGNITVQLQLMGTGLIIVVSVLVQTYQSLKNKVESKKYRRLIGE